MIGIRTTSADTEVRHPCRPSDPASDGPIRQEPCQRKEVVRSDRLVVLLHGLRSYCYARDVYPFGVNSTEHQLSDRTVLSLAWLLP